MAHPGLEYKDYYAVLGVPRTASPAEIKKAVVGTGAATKEQVQFMVTRLLRLKTPPQPADASDGVAAALAYILRMNIPSMESETVIQLRK